jgi:hypothetical protein
MSVVATPPGVRLLPDARAGPLVCDGIGLVLRGRRPEAGPSTRPRAAEAYLARSMTPQATRGPPAQFMTGPLGQ